MIEVTIAIPVYNREKMVVQALESALAQNVKGLEILVVDNCSTDGTWEVLQGFSDPRLRIVRNETNVGLQGNFNRCLELAGGRYVMVLCSDDRLLNDAIANLMEFVHGNKPPVLVSGGGRAVDELGRVVSTEGKVIPPGRYRKGDAMKLALTIMAGYRRNIFNLPSGVIFNRQTALKTGGFHPTMASTDFEMFLRLSSEGDIVIIDKDVCEVVRHSGANSLRPDIRGILIDETLSVIEKYGAVFGERFLKEMKAIFSGAQLLAVPIYLLKGNWKAVRGCLKIPMKYGVFLHEMIVGMLEHLWLRFFGKKESCI